MNGIIVLNWNTTDLLIGMYNSARSNSQNPFHFVIIDNGSREEEVDKLFGYFKKLHNEQVGEKHNNSNFVKDLYEYKNKDFIVTIKKLPKNIGFAAGNNVGLKLLDSKITNVIFINSDILIEEKFWDSKFDVLLSGLNVGIIGPAYHPLRWNKDGRFQIQAKTTEPVESESVQGAFFGIRYSVLDTVIKKDGFVFDENFKFAHYEETDLCFRIMNLGYKCLWFPCAHQHLHNSSGTKKNGYKLSDEIQCEADFKMNSERNRQLLMRKHDTFFKGKS